MNRVREKSIVSAILRYLNSQPNAIARKRWGSGFGLAGEPDIDACVRGRSVQLEVKRPGEEPTLLQRKRLAEWCAAGAVTAVVTSLEEVRVLLARNGLT